MNKNTGPLTASEILFNDISSLRLAYSRYQLMFRLSVYLYAYTHSPLHTHTHPYTHMYTLTPTHTCTHSPLHTHTQPYTHILNPTHILTPTLNPKGHSSCTLLGGCDRRVVAGQQMKLVPTTVGLHGNQRRGGVRGKHT